MRAPPSFDASASHTGLAGNRLLGVALAAAVLGLVAVAAGAQMDVLYVLESPGQVGGEFGCCVSGAGDVNGDGYDDLLVGALRANGGATDAGMAYVFSGNGGNLLYSLESPNPTPWGFFGGCVSGAGDLDGDGYDDVLIGAAGEEGGALDAGRAYAFGGHSGAVLYTLQSPNPEANGSFGSSVSRLGDVDTDGRPDLVIGALRENGGQYWTDGRAYIFSGATGSALHVLQSPNPATEHNSYFGTSVSGTGDADGDGWPDVIVGTRYEDGGATSAGRAYIFDGFSGIVLHALESANPMQFGNFGWSVSGAGDVDNDGHTDVVVGAHGEYVGVPGAGRAYVFSGAGGNLLHTLESPNAQYVGWFSQSGVSGVGDVDNDGYDDIMVGAEWEDGFAPGEGRVYIFSGYTGAPLFTLVAERQRVGGFDHFGSSIARAGDVNADGYEDLIVTAVYQGKVYVLSGTALGADPPSHRAAACVLLHSWPNPFSETTTVRFALSTAGHVDLRIYDLKGSLISTLVDQPRQATGHDIHWDGCDDAGHTVPPGTYISRLSADGQTQSRRLVLIR